MAGPVLMDDLISREALRQAMYHEAFEVDSDEQKWDSGCWIRYKMFERVVESIPSAQKHWKEIRMAVTKDVRLYMDKETIEKLIAAYLSGGAHEEKEKEQ